jgi:polysaccharide pyruvyl transferase WcaK-like protein
MRRGAVELIIKHHRDFIKNNFSLYDFIVARDGVTKEALDRCEIDAVMLPDCVILADRMHTYIRGEDWTSPIYNAIVVRNIGGYNDRIAGATEKIKKQLGDKIPCYILTVNSRDYYLYKELLPDNDSLICITDPGDLIRFFRGTECVVSFRVHGSIMALQSGAEVMNIAMDSRSDIIETFYGFQSPSCEAFLNDPMVQFKKKILPADSLVGAVQKRVCHCNE